MDLSISLIVFHTTFSHNFHDFSYEYILKLAWKTQRMEIDSEMFVLIFLKKILNNINIAFMPLVTSGCIKFFLVKKAIRVVWNKYNLHLEFLDFHQVAFGSKSIGFLWSKMGNSSALHINPYLPALKNYCQIILYSPKVKSVEFMSFPSQLGKMFFRYGKSRKSLYDPDVTR